LMNGPISSSLFDKGNLHGFTTVAAVVCMLLSALTALVATAPSVEAEEPVYVYKIGVTEDPDSFNPFDMMSGTSWSVAHMMYEFLYAVGPVMDPYPQLAASHEVSDDFLTWTYHLVENSYWHDGLPVTAHDVVFTFKMIMDYPRECALMGGYLEGFDDVVALDDHTVEVTLLNPKANMLSLIVPILPEHLWTKVRDSDVGIDRVEMWDTEYFPEGPVGSGPFILNEYNQAQGYISLLAQKPYHRLPGIEVDSVNIDELLFIIYKNDNAMVTDLEIGNIDAVDGVPSLSWDTLMENPDIDGQTPATHILEEFGFNCAPPEMRESVNEDGERNFPDASTNYETCNLSVRQAMTMATDIPYVADVIHQGRAQEAYAIIPPATPFWHYPVPEEDKWHNYGIEGANALLDRSGYGKFDTDGVRMNETNDARLEFEFYYIRSNLEDELTAEKMQEWWDEIGVKVNLHASAEGILYNLEFEMGYDLFIWSWWPDVDPSWFLSVLTTDEIPLDESDNTKWSDTFYSNPVYDQLYLEQNEETDIFERQAIVHEMQRIVYRDCPYICLVYPAGLIAYRIDNYENYPDMEVSAGITPSSFWFYFSIEPKGVPAFDVGLSPSYEVQRDQDVSFSVMIHDSDGDALEVTWIFGDGSDEKVYTYDAGTTATSFEASASHTYDTLASGLVLTVSVTDGTHVRNNTASVDVSTLANLVPVIGNPSCSPPEAYIGQTTTWSITASDAEETELTVTWDWDDGSFTTTTETAGAPGESILIELTHVFDNPGDYDVTVWVNDGYDEPGHNNSFTFATYSVIANSPPYALTVADTATNVDIWTSLSATARDADPDTLRFTWEWDDGTFNVTEYDTSSNPNAVVVDDVWHMWDTPDTYSVTVWVDDLTGEAGHNISSTIEVVVSLDGDLPPSSIQLIADPDPAIQGQPVEMVVRAADGNGDALTITVEFGDGEDYTDSTVGGTTGAQSILAVHTYVDVDTYVVTVYVNDGTFNVSKTFGLLVEEPPENSPPSIQLAGSYSAMYNETFTITPMTISDADGDELTVWYDWGDGSPMTEGDVDYSASHEYQEVATFTLKAYVDDGIPEPGHNVSATAQVTVSSNLKPTINGLPKYSPTENVTVGVEITFTVNVSDPEGDPMVVKIIFGDSQDVAQETVNNTGSSENFTVTLTHTYTTSGDFDVKIWVEDDKSHKNPSWSESTLTLTVDPISDEGDDGGGNLTAIGVAAALAIIVAVAAMALLLKRKKGSEPEFPEDESSPEQMPEPPEPPET
jgi:peptide/nickel transport system substrate-binding protein